MALHPWKLEKNTMLTSLSWRHNAGPWELSANHMLRYMITLHLIGSQLLVALFASRSNGRRALNFNRTKFKITPEARQSMKKKRNCNLLMEVLKMRQVKFFLK